MLYLCVTLQQIDVANYRNHVSASGGGFNTTGKGNNRKAGYKGLMKNTNLNAKDVKPDRK